MDKWLNVLIVVVVSLLMLPAIMFAQLPTPTYGWNLGNTLEAPGGDNVAVAWSGPGITQEVIDGMFLSPWLTGLYGDFTGNGSVSVEDLDIFTENWLLDNCILTSAIDLDGNCIVDFFEFSQMAQNWDGN